MNAKLQEAIAEAAYGDFFHFEDVMGKEMFIKHYAYACGVGDAALKAFCLDALWVYTRHGICAGMEWTRAEDGGWTTMARPDYNEMAKAMFVRLREVARIFKSSAEEKKFYADMLKIYDKHPGVYIRRGR